MTTYHTEFAIEGLDPRPRQKGIDLGKGERPRILSI